jgi:hypothetical protein
MSEIDHILPPLEIGFCQWPPSSWLERHLDAGDHPGWEPLPAPELRLQHDSSCLLSALNAELQALMTAPKPD